jgi:general secretion pathway protein A
VTITRIVSGNFSIIPVREGRPFMFGRKSTQRWFFESSVHVEAVSRLLYLIESKAGLALVHGADGAGRTLLLQQLRAELLSQQVYTLLLNVSGLDADGLLLQIAGGLNIVVEPSTVCRAELVQRIRDELLGRAQCRLQTTILLDDLHRSFSEVTPVVQFLSGINAQAEGMVNVVGSSISPRISGLQSGMLLSIPLGPLSVDESFQFVVAFLKDHANQVPSVDISAVRAVTELAGRLPAQLLRVCHLLTVVAETSPHLQIDAAVVRDIISEVSPRAVA